MKLLFFMLLLSKKSTIKEYHVQYLERGVDQNHDSEPKAMPGLAVFAFSHIVVLQSSPLRWGFIVIQLQGKELLKIMKRNI